SNSSSSRTWELGREKGSGGRLWRRSRRRRWLCEEEARPRAWRKATTMPMRRNLTSAAGAAADPRKEVFSGAIRSGGRCGKGFEINEGSIREGSVSIRDVSTKFGVAGGSPESGG
ncbi:hypothetical protein LINGRAHAP2_LOCUS23031, partial [Linum grandiflorum]